MDRKMVRVTKGALCDQCLSDLLAQKLSVEVREHKAARLLLATDLKALASGEPVQTALAAAVEARINKLKIKAAGTLANNLCPDHRDLFGLRIRENLKTELPLNQLFLDTPRSYLFPMGTIIWRPVDFEPTITLSLVPFEKTPKGSYMGRVLLNGNFISEPEAYCSGSGSVIFIDRMPPEDWTHLVVTGTSKAMQAPPAARGAGSAIFAKVPTPYDLNKYFDFRLAIRAAMLENPNASYDDKLQLALANWSADSRPGDRRLVYDGRACASEDGRWQPGFDHIYMPEAEEVSA